MPIRFGFAHKVHKTT